MNSAFMPKNPVSGFAAKNRFKRGEGALDAVGLNALNRKMHLHSVLGTLRHQAAHRSL
jgi:hypothetical protein